MPLRLPEYKSKKKSKKTEPRQARKPMQYLASRIYNTPLLIAPPKLDAILAAIGNRIGLIQESKTSTEDWIDNDENDDETETIANEQGIAVLEIHGTLVRRGGYIDAASGLRSYEAIKSMFEKAMDDQQVHAIVLDIDSPGGEASGVDELSDMIYDARGKKPIVAIANDSAYSAAYWIASAADKILVTKMGGVGSIGVYALHADISKWDEKTGIKYTYIYSGKQKVDGNPHEPLKDSAKERLQEQVDNIRNMFVSAVARNRNTDEEDIYKTEAGIYTGKKALGLLADKVGTMQDALELAQSMIKSARSRDIRPEAATSGFVTQSLIFPKSKWKSKADAQKWARDHGYKDDVDETEDSFRMRQRDPKDFVRLRTICINPGNSTPMDDCKVKSVGGPLKAGKKAESLIESIYAVSESLKTQFISKGFADIDFNQDRYSERPIAYNSDLLPNVLSLRRFGTTALSNTEKNEAKIIGVLAPYNSFSCDMGGFKEIYEPGCFSDWLKSNDDAYVLAFHNPEHVLGRRSNETARFWEESNGLHYEAILPDTQISRDCQTLIERGDIGGASAAFYILKHRWEQRSNIRVRVIEKAYLVEGSLHSFAAYQESSSAVVEKEQKTAAESQEFELISARLRILKLKK